MAVNPVQLYLPPANGAGGMFDPADDVAEFERRRRENRERLAAAMAQRRIDHPLQGVHQLAEAALAGYDEYKARQEREKAQQEAAALYERLYFGNQPAGGQQSPPVPSQTAAEARGTPPAAASIPADIKENFGITPPPPTFDMAGTTFGFGDAGMPGAPVPAPAPPPPQVASPPPPPMPQPAPEPVQPPPMPPPPAAIGMPGGPPSIADLEARGIIPGGQGPQAPRPITRQAYSSSPLQTMPPSMERVPMPQEVSRPQLPPLSMGQMPAMPGPLEAPPMGMALPSGAPAVPPPAGPDLRNRALTRVAGLQPEIPSAPPMPLPPVDAGVVARPQGLMSLGAATLMNDGVTSSVAPPEAASVPRGVNFDFLRNDPRFVDRTRDGGRALNLDNLESVVFHDRAGNYPGNSPYHIEVTPDGKIYNHFRPDQVGAHAYRFNPRSIGVAYGGAYGSTPTPEAMDALRFVYGGLREQNPNLRFETHGEAFARTRGTPMQASRDGRDMREAQWLRTIRDSGGAPATQTAENRTPTPSNPQATGLIQMAQSGQGMTPELFRQMMLNPYTRGMAQQMLAQEIKSRQGPTVDQQLERDLKQAQIDKLRRDNEGSPGAGLQVTYGRDAEGNWVALQPTKDGRFIPTRIPEGVTIDPALVTAEKARAKEVGEGTGKSQYDLPRVEQLTDRIVGQIDSVIKDPNLPNVTGWQALVPFTLNPQNVDVEERIKQLTGAAFLQAFESLKGGGQITEVEGDKATQALARLKNLRQSDEGFLTALNEFRSEVLKLRDLARAKAAGGYKPAPTSSGTPTAPTAPAGSNPYSTMSDDELKRRLGIR